MSDSFLYTPNALCALMPRPLVCHGMLLSWMQSHFSAPEFIEDPLLQETAIWNEDETKSQILIESVFRWKPSTTEQRMALLLKRGPWQIVRMGIDDRQMGTTYISGAAQYITFIQGSHTFFCLSNAPAECELLTTEVYRELIEFGPLFRPLFKLHRFVVQSVGDVSIVEEARQNFVIPITVAYAAEEHWEISQTAPPLKTIKLSTFLP